MLSCRIPSALRDAAQIGQADRGEVQGSVLISAFEARSDRWGVAPPGELPQQRVERLCHRIALQDTHTHVDECSYYDAGLDGTFTWRPMPMGLTWEPRRLGARPCGARRWTYVTCTQLRSVELVEHAANEPRQLLMNASNELAKVLVRQQRSMEDISVRDVCSRHGITSGGDRGRISKYAMAITAYKRRGVSLEPFVASSNQLPPAANSDRMHWWE